MQRDPLKKGFVRSLLKRNPLGYSTIQPVVPSRIGGEWVAMNRQSSSCVYEVMAIKNLSVGVVQQSKLKFPGSPLKVVLAVKNQSKKVVPTITQLSGLT
jgi:hypothetical protein